MQGWGDQWEEDFGTKGQHWVVTRDSTWWCEHDDCNIAVFTRTLLSILHCLSRQNHFFGRKNRMVQPDSLNVGNISLVPGQYDMLRLSPRIRRVARRAYRAWCLGVRHFLASSCLV